jgi:integrase
MDRDPLNPRLGRIKRSPFRVTSHRGEARLDFTTPSGERYRPMLGVPYAGADRATPAERRRAYEKAEEVYRRLTAGRVLESDPVIKTAATLAESYDLYVQQFAPLPGDDENLRRRRQASLIVRKSYGTNIAEWAVDVARRPDGAPRWAGDRRTPLQRVLDAPNDYLAFRLTRVLRKTMKKEKSNLVQFFQWLKAQGLIARVPAVELPAGKGTPAVKSGRGQDLYLTNEEVARIVSVLPVWSSRAARNGGAVYLVQPFFELMYFTGLRPVTLARLATGPGGNWRKGSKYLELKDEDDKAKYGRRLPLSAPALAVLSKYAPASGPIFGHHDYRKHIAAAAAKVLDPVRAKLFGAYHLRHFVATFLASRTTNMAAAGYVLGHKDLTTTSGYVHAREAEAATLVKATERELARAARSAAKWAAGKGKEKRA